MAQDNKEQNNREENQENQNKRDDKRLSLRDSFNRFFDDDFWVEPFDLIRSPRRLFGRMSGGLFPRVDITENDKEIKVVADIPGVNPDDVDISVEGNKMRLSGKTNQEKEINEQDKPYKYERIYGEFSREFALPTKVKDGEIKATCKDGVLTITMPKAEDSQRKRIKIEKGE